MTQPAVSTYKPEANDAVELVVNVNGVRTYVIRNNARNDLYSVVDVSRPWERSNRVLGEDFQTVDEALTWINLDIEVQA